MSLLSTTNLLTTTLATLGTFTALTLSYRLLRFVHLHLSTPPPSRSLSRYLRPEAYALVTGASDGIGLAFATTLASRGFNLVLHGRNSNKLENVRSSLTTQYPKQDFRMVVADASDAQNMETSIATIVSSLSTLPGPLTILINNVGGQPRSISSRALLSISEQTHDHTSALLTLNAEFPAQMTRALLPILTSDSNTPACIINMSSIASQIGFPYTAIYGASKAFNLLWSVALSREMKMQKKAVEVLALIVGEVCDTSFSREQKGTWMKPTAKVFVESALNKIGCGRLSVVPWWGHGVLIAVSLHSWSQCGAREDVTRSNVASHTNLTCVIDFHKPARMVANNCHETADTASAKR